MTQNLPFGKHSSRCHIPDQSGTVFPINPPPKLLPINPSPSIHPRIQAARPAPARSRARPRKRAHESRVQVPCPLGADPIPTQSRRARHWSFPQEIFPPHPTRTHRIFPQSSRALPPGNANRDLRRRERRGPRRTQPRAGCLVTRAQLVTRARLAAGPRLGATRPARRKAPGSAR